MQNGTAKIEKHFSVSLAAIYRVKSTLTMTISLRTRLLGAMLLGFALPCLAGLLLQSRATLQYGRQQHGLLYQAGARDLSHSLAILTNNEIDKTNDWAALTNLAAQIARADRLSGLTPAAYVRAAQQGDADWEKNALVARQLLASPLSARLREFTKLNPLWHEVFVTGARGQLVAATNRTSDFRQDDEAWWQNAHKLSGRAAWVEGIQFDESADIYALEVSFPLREKAGGPVVGILKGVLDASQLFARVPPANGEAGLRRDVVLSDGRVLARLEDATYKPLSVRLHGDGVAALGLGVTEKEQRSGWTAASFGASGAAQPRLAGYASLDFDNSNLDLMAMRGLTPMTVVISNEQSRVLAPLYARFWTLLGGGAILLALCVGAGWQLLRRAILEPLQTVRKATQQLAEQAQMSGEDKPVEGDNAALVAQLESVKTGDEIGELAHDFATMARRVVNYQAHLEHEVAVKTGEMQRDLQLAREFQESLLPSEYPTVSDCESHDALTLSFHHVYQPALTVGGDFFDIFKVSEQCVGIFIADVMGHGARSALVTAILRTLLQDLAAEGENPARLLELVNNHFYNIVSNAGSFVFATACCLTIDCATGEARFASAGHPPPFILDRIADTVEELSAPISLDNIYANAALGLDKTTVYDVLNFPIHAGQTFVLYTDGVPEAPAPDGEEWGEERLSELLRVQARSNTPDVCRSILGEVQIWLAGRPAPDDICVIEIEIGAPHARHEAATPPAMALTAR